MNLVATWASGEEFCRSSGFLIYLESLRVIDNAEKIVFTHDMPDDVRSLLKDRGIRVVNIDPLKIHFLIRDRYLAYWNFLIENQQYEHCIFTDCKDVIFQANPFGYMFFGDNTILVSEGMKHSQSGWNSIDQYECQRNVREFPVSMSDRPVLNGGVLMGSPKGLKNLFLLLWTNTVRCTGVCTEQSVLNYLYSFLEKEGKWNYVVADPYSDWMCLTGEAVKEGHVECVFKDGIFFHAPSAGPDNPYYIVHQYERIPGAFEVISKKYLAQTPI